MWNLQWRSKHCIYLCMFGYLSPHLLPVRKRRYCYSKLSCRLFLLIKPTKSTDFSNLFLEWNSTYFGQFLCPSSGVFHCTHSNGICHTGWLTAFKQDQDGTAVVSLLCVQWKTPDDGQRNCLKHREFHSKKKFEKLVHLVGFYCKKFITMDGHMNLKFAGSVYVSRLYCSLQSHNAL